MQNRYCKIILCLLCIITIITKVYSTEKREHFLSYGPGVAAASMGGTFTAIGNDVSVIYYNPALIGNLESNEVSANYWSLLADTRYMFLGIALQISEHSGFAISGTQLATDDIEIRQTLDDTSKKDSASQNVINIAYGGYVESLELSYGIGVKYLYYNIVGYSDSGGGIDLGLYKRIKQWNQTAIDSAIVVQNIVNMPIKLKEDDESAPVIAKCGFGLKTLLFPKYSKQKDSFTYDKLKIGLDFGTEDHEFIYSFGGEYMLYDLIMFRAGYSGEDINVGFGIKCYGFQFDYSYQFSEVESINKVGFLYRWGTKNKFTYSKTQNITEDFQNVYKQANRLYENSVRDSRTMIESNKLDEAISLLYRTVPLKPQDNEAKNLLEVAQDKKVANKTNKYLNNAQQLIDKNSIVASYKETLKALQVAPTSDVKQFLKDHYSTKSIVNKVSAIKENEIKQYVDNIDSAIIQQDFSKAQEETEKLEVLNPKTAKEYFDEITSKKEILANNYIKLAIQSKEDNNLVQSYNYLCIAEELIGSDEAVSELKNKVRKQIIKSKENSFEEKMYTEKLYYLAAISLANNTNVKESYKELQEFDPTFKWNYILEEYLIKTNSINRKLSN